MDLEFLDSALFSPKKAVPRRANDAWELRRNFASINQLKGNRASGSPLRQVKEIKTRFLSNFRMLQKISDRGCS
jgi:hypothetical protein